MAVLRNLSNTLSPEKAFRIYEKGNKIGLCFIENNNLGCIGLICNNGIRLSNREINELDNLELNDGFFMAYGDLYIESCVIIPVDSIDERYSTLAFVKPFADRDYTFCFSLYDRVGRIADSVYELGEKID